MEVVYGYFVWFYVLSGVARVSNSRKCARISCFNLSGVLAQSFPSYRIYFKIEHNLLHINESSVLSGSKYCLCWLLDELEAAENHLFRPKIAENWVFLWKSPTFFAKCTEENKYRFRAKVKMHVVKELLNSIQHYSGPNFSNCWLFAKHRF